MKYKNCIKTISFTLIFILAFHFVTQIVTVSTSSRQFQWMSNIYEEPKDSLDAVYIGSSTCYAFWNPILAWKEYGITVCSYACSDQPLAAAEYLIKEARKTQPNAVYILNINSLGAKNGSVNDVVMHRLLDYMPLSQNKLELTDYLCDLADLSFSDRLEYYFPIIRYHEKWTELTADNFSAENNGLKGASLYPSYLKKAANVSDNYIVSEEYLEISEVLEQSINSLLDYCDKENLKVIFVTVPQARGNKDDISQFNTVNSMIEERGYTVLDLTEQIDEIGIDLTRDYYNNRHLNIHGSIKFTCFLSEYLINNYGFTDKRQNSDYSSWNTAYERYADIIAPYVLDFETTPKVRTDQLEAPSLKIKKDNANAILSWNNVADADGYIIYKKTSADSAWEPLLETTNLTCTVLLPDKEETHYYTVVPFLNEGNYKYYGDYRYAGIQLTASN